ncbi:AraC family transcriptional regulator ligand-binding domain-containing protein, partial [Pontibacter sp. JAM-7]|uniref:AraC family transcriptional regulator ligand-binding domain-containing protein n=1 Tax=Pontibacter sp. JAM-7 TaxID=3366581 RepID=UPI003AF98E34
MSYENQTISMHYAQAVVTAAKRHNIAPDILLPESGISEAMLKSDGMRITPLQLSILMQSAWSLEDDEFMGMAAQPCRHGVFSLMAHQVVHRPNLRSVYRHLCRFYNLTTQAFILDFYADKDTAYFT